MSSNKVSMALLCRGCYKTQLEAARAPLFTYMNKNWHICLSYGDKQESLWPVSFSHRKPAILNSIANFWAILYLMILIEFVPTVFVWFCNFVSPRYSPWRLKKKEKKCKSWVFITPCDHGVKESGCFLDIHCEIDFRLLVCGKTLIMNIK